MALVDSEERVRAAAETFVYGYPLVYSLSERAGFAEGHSSLPLSAPWNEFGYARELLGPETTFVSPNNDTLYVIAPVDLRPGPLVLHVPDTADRYYVLQFVDAWTNNFAYIGRRATGTAEREFLLAAPDDTTKAPEGIDMVRAPTGVVTIVGRVQINGAADAPAVHALQDRFTLTPLSADPGVPAGVPEAAAGVAEDLRWWEEFRLALAAFPPPAADAPMLAIARDARAHRLGVAVRRPGSRSRRRPHRRTAGRPGADRGSRQGRTAPAERVDVGDAHVRLQRRLPRPRDDRCA